MTASWYHSSETSFLITLPRYDHTIQAVSFITHNARWNVSPRHYLYWPRELTLTNVPSVQTQWRFNAPDTESVKLGLRCHNKSQSEVGRVWRDQWEERKMLRVLVVSNWDADSIWVGPCVSRFALLKSPLRKLIDQNPHCSLWAVSSGSQHPTFNIPISPSWAPPPDGFYKILLPNFTSSIKYAIHTRLSPIDQELYICTYNVQFGDGCNWLYTSPNWDLPHLYWTHGRAPDWLTNDRRKQWR